MSKSKSELSITKRYMLEYICFKTRNNYAFFANNEFIAEAIGLTVNTAKTFINDLIRDGYLYKEIDKKGRRVLSLTGKEYKRLCLDMTNVDKKVLKSERDTVVNENQYLQEQLTFSEGRVNSLVPEKTDLTLTNEELTRKVKELEERITKLEETVSTQSDRIMKLENIFYKNGISKTQLDEMIEKNENIKSNTTQNGT